jgi:hypothetical protein
VNPNETPPENVTQQLSILNERLYHDGALSKEEKDEIKDYANTKMPSAFDGGKKSRRRRGMKKVKQNKTKRIHAIVTRRRKQMKKAGTKRR